MINDAIIEGDTFHHYISPDTKRVYRAYCGNCGCYSQAQQRERSILRHKPHAKKGDAMCPDCNHALYWKFGRVNKDVSDTIM